MPALLVRYPGQWRRIFQAPDTSKFKEPTVEGVDFPTVRVRRARYNAARRTLQLAITTRDDDQRGRPSSLRVTRLTPGSRVTVVVDERPGIEHRVQDGVITVETTVGDHRIAVHSA
jgi:hypothetical protein